MMCLYELQMNTENPLESCKKIVPVFILLWNSMKGPIDDPSKDLSHNLGLFSPMSPIVVISIQIFSTMLYNSRRLYSLKWYMITCMDHASYTKDTRMSVSKKDLFLRFFERVVHKHYLAQQYISHHERNRQCRNPITNTKANDITENMG